MRTYKPSDWTQKLILVARQYRRIYNKITASIFEDTEKISKFTKLKLKKNLRTRLDQQLGKKLIFKTNCQKISRVSLSLYIIRDSLIRENFRQKKNYQPISHVGKETSIL